MRLPPAVRPLALAALVLLASGCAETRYLLQAGPGQLELIWQAESIEDVLADPDTSPRTRLLLGEIARIRAFGNARGLKSSGSYESFVDLRRSAVVYFLAGSRPLSFEPKLWSFPLVGSFPYTGWFDYKTARRARDRLRADGWDVYLRSVRAYSTGGWFKDPVLSTMLTGDDDAFRYLSAVILHELVHGNFFIPDQATFNESLASFVGDVMADDYLVERFGEESEQVTLYREELAEYAERSKILVAAYQKLEALYASDKPDDAKLREKAIILRQLRIDADLSYQPNNASLIGFKTYNSGLEELAGLYAACGKSWPRFFKKIRTLKRSSFPSEQLEKLGPFIESLTAAGC